MLQNINLRELAELRGNGRDFVSAYFAGPEGLESLKGREKRLRELLAENDLELQNFDRSMQLIRDALAEHRTDHAAGVCMFASAILDFVRGYPTTLELPAELHVGPAPHIRPLAELQDEYATFAVVACDNSATRIYVVTNHEAEVEQAVKGGVKNRVRKGGWSQQRYARRRKNQFHHYADEVCETLSDLVRRREIKRIVLVGSAETMREIQALFPSDLAERIVGSEPIDLHAGEDAIIEHAYDSYFADERQFEQSLWERIKNEYMRHGLAVTGATDVLEAARAGRVEHAIVTRKVKLAGTHCRDCEHVVHGTPQTCQKCGSKSVFALDLVDELARQLELTSADLEFSDEIAGLSKAGHVAALLRY